MIEPKLGVALTKCYFCHEDGDIVMNTRLTASMAAKVESMHGKVINMEPCAKCAGYMKIGIILITIDDEKSGRDWHRDQMPNPYRTGGWWVIKDEAVQRMIPNSPEMFAWAQKHRFMFIEHEAAEKLGLFEAAKNENEKNDGNQPSPTGGEDPTGR